MGTILQDLRYGARMLLKKPGFTLIAVATLALGIGANTAIFSLLDQVMLRRLPVEKPDELVVLRSPGPMRGHVSSDSSDSFTSFSYPMYNALREKNAVFAGLMARYAIPLSVSFSGQTERAAGELVSGNYFEVLGVRPAMGRVFSLEDDKLAGAHPVAVLSHGYWTRRFGANPSVLNQTLLINGHQLTVVGVARAGFGGVQTGQRPDVFIPMTMQAQMMPGQDKRLTDWNDYWIAVIGRLKPGETSAQAEAGVLPLYQSLLVEQLPSLRNPTKDWSDRFLAKRLLLTPGGRGRLVAQSDMGTPLWALFGMVLLVLLIACTNVANLLLVRGLGRQREMAIRLALGASRWQLVRQLLVESLLLSFIGGAVGLLLASWVSDALVRAVSDGGMMTGLSAGLDMRILTFGFALSVVTGIICGLLPARRVTRGDMVSALKDQSSASSASLSQTRLRKGLVVAQVALTMLLLVGAGLMARTLWNLRHVDLGMKPERMMTFSLAPDLNGYKPVQAIALANNLRESLSAVPGVQAVAVAEVSLLTNNNVGSNVTVEGAAERPNAETHVLKNWVGPDSFSALGTPLVAGREFKLSDNAVSQKVAIINETAAKQYFPTRNPIGARFAFGGGNVQLDTEIVGVVKDNKHSSVREQPKAFFYLPYAQDKEFGQITFYVRAMQDAATIGPLLRNEVRRLDANLPVFDLKTMETVIGESLFGERMMAFLSVCFGVLAALLAAIGLYGVLAYWVVQRTHEIGIRVALGAGPRDVRGLVMGQGIRLTLIGVVIGLAGALGLTQLMKTLLYGVGAADPITFVAVAVLLGLVALLACWLPARRATKVDPMIALRYE
ncbi:MAG: ABC transporter permease [Acidobacteriota bacterium]|nr:ABC transporter permease [Acidobacteriota bacterium]